MSSSSLFEAGMAQLQWQKEWKEPQNINRPELLGSITPGRETGQNPSVPVCPTVALKAGEGKEDMAGKV